MYYIIVNFVNYWLNHLSSKKKIYYWSPSLVDIATNMAVINSAYSLNKYNSCYESYVLNFFGEFERFKEEIKKKNIKLIDHYKKNIWNFFPKYGKIKSRISFVLIFILSFFPLKNLIKNKKPDFLIIHLITSLPLFLLIFFNFQTKFILRISGYPRMNFLRKFLWKLASKKIFLVTCPTINTMKYIKSLNIIDNEKIKLLYDPIIEIKKINLKKNQSLNFKNYFFFSRKID